MTRVWSSHAGFNILVWKTFENWPPANSRKPDEWVIYGECLDMKTMMWFVASVFLHNEMLKPSEMAHSWARSCLSNFKIKRKPSDNQLMSSSIQVSDIFMMIPPLPKEQVVNCLLQPKFPNISYTCFFPFYEDNGSLWKCADKMWTFLDNPFFFSFLFIMKTSPQRRF